MKEGAERFDVSKTTSVMKTTKLNIANNEDMKFYDEKIKCNGDVSGLESTGSDSPYDDYVEFDPSTFRLTPQSTISPKRDGGFMNEFKSVDSYDSLVLLSVEESAEDFNMYKLNENELVVENDNDDQEVLPLVQDVLVPVDDDEPKTNITLVEDFSPSNSDDVEMVDVSLVEDDVNAGNVSFDLSFPSNKEDNKEVDKGDNETDKNKEEDNREEETERDSLDSERLMSYLKNEKVNEICKRLKADLKGTKQYNYEELPLTDQIPFSERVYNYISELKAYSSISSQDRTTSSRLTSVDLKTLQSLDTVDTADTEERVKDFEQALEEDREDNLDNTEKTMDKMDKDKEEDKEKEEEGVVDVDMERDNWVEQSKVDRKMSFEMGLKNLKYATNHEEEDKEVEDEENMKEREEKAVVEELSKYNLENQQTQEQNLDKNKEEDMDNLGDNNREDMDMDVNKDLEMRTNEFQLEYRMDMDNDRDGDNSRDSLDSEEKERGYNRDNNTYKDKETKDKEENMKEEDMKDRELEEYWKPELIKGSTTDSLNYDDKWYGLECMASSYGVNLVYSCLRSIKIQVGDNLHEYDAYTGTKKKMARLLELMKRFNGLEKKLRGDFLSLEKNDYTLEATRSSYVTLAKSNSRLEGLLEYYKEYEKLQKDSIKLKSDNVSLIRRQILNKLSEYQTLSKMNENTEGMEVVENRLSELYNETGFFVLPLYNETHSNYDFMYLFNFNYYSGYNLGYLKNKNNKEYRTERGREYTTNNERDNRYNVYKEDNRYNTYNMKYNNQNQMVLNTKDKRYYCLEAVTPQMLEKLKVLEHLPYKPRKVTPDLELKLFMYFQSDASSSSLCSSSDGKCFVSSNPLSSGSSCSPMLPCLDFFSEKNNRFGSFEGKQVNQMNFNNREYKDSTNRYNYKYNRGEEGYRDNNRDEGYKNKESELMGMNLEVDVNMLVDLYSVRNDLKLVLYSPFHKDTPYYRFKLDLVDCFNHLLSLKMSSYVDELTENVQLSELLEVLVHFTSELNLKFVYYLKLFSDLLKLSTNHYYLLSDSNNTYKEDNRYNSRDEGYNRKYKDSTNRYNYKYDNKVDDNKYNLGKSDKDKVLKLMLTFKNNVPCLWCNVHFNFDYKKDKNKYLQYFNKDFKDGLICGVNFEFVHKLNKTYFETYEGTLKKLNETVNSVNKNKGLIEHIVSTLNSQQYFM